LGIAPVKTIELAEFKAALPKQMRKGLNPVLIDEINSVILDPEIWDAYTENLFSYTDVLANGRYTIQQYVNAVKYVTYKVINLNNTEAYIKTFPERYKSQLSKGKTNKEISVLVTSYNSGKLVMTIYKQAMIPIALVNAPKVQKMLNVLLTIAEDEEQNGRTRVEAADKFISHCAMPEEASIALDVNIKHGSAGDIINTYKQAIAMMVNGQMKAIADGGDLKQIVNAPIIIEGEVIE